MNRANNDSDRDQSYSLETLAEAVNYHRFVYGLMEQYLGRRVLEFGAGIGNQTPLFLQDGRDVCAIDIDQRLLDQLKRNVSGAPFLSVHCVRIQELAQQDPFRSSFDSVVSSNVLEHLSDEEEKTAVNSMNELLKEGGHAVHWAPAFPGIFGSLDRSFVHYRRYTRASATTLFRNAGFDVVQCSYWNMAGFFGWWFYGRVVRAHTIPRASALFFDRWMMPVLRRIEPGIPRPFGQSLFIVARKPFKGPTSK